MTGGVKITGPYAVLDVNCRSLDDLLDAGQYGYVDLNIRGQGCQCGKCKPYKVERLYDPHVRLIDFGRDIDSKEAVEAMKKMGYRPANFKEKLLLAKDYPDFQRTAIIITLGHIHYDHYYQGSVAALSMTVANPGNYSKRMLREYSLKSSNPFEKDWCKKDGNFVFAAVEITDGKNPRDYLETCADWWGF